MSTITLTPSVVEHEVVRRGRLVGDLHSVGEARAASAGDETRMPSNAPPFCCMMFLISDAALSLQRDH